MRKSDLTGTIKASRKLPAGAGKFPPVTCGNRTQSLLAEIFACIRRYFYLRNSLPAALAGKFARASFTVKKGFQHLDFLSYPGDLFQETQKVFRMKKVLAQNRSEKLEAESIFFYLKSLFLARVNFFLASNMLFVSLCQA